MKIKNIQEFRTWFKNLKRSRQNQWCDENFMGSTHGDYTGFLGMYHGDKDDIYGFLRKEVEMAEDGQAIYEFVQNAADSDSTHFYMLYNEKYIVAINNGEQFSKEGVKSILNIGQSFGKTDPDKIGRFGIGFKLVHRLVGKTQGLDELLNKDGNGYRGPVMFSWSKKSQLEEFIYADTFDNSLIDDPQAPWLLKILATNFPSNPNEKILDINYKESIPFPTSEVQEFQNYLKEIKGNLDLNSLNQGTMFFIKLGENKYDYLKNQESEYSDGLTTSMHFLKSLEVIKINNTEIRKDNNVNNVKEFLIENNSNDFIKVGLTEERDKQSDIKFKVCYADSIESGEEIKSHPNIYKYFPAVKEVNNLSFIIHSNVFELTSNRQNLTETSINKALLTSLSDLITSEMDKDKTTSKQNYYNLFASIVLSDEPNSNAGNGWQKEYFYDNLVEYAINNIPTKESNFLNQNKVAIKKTKLHFNPKDLGVDVEWLVWSSKKYKEIITRIKSNFKVHKFNIGNIIENGNIDKINEWIRNLTTDDYKIFLKELDENIPSNNFEDIEFIKNSRGYFYSINDLKAEGNKHLLIGFNKIKSILDILTKINFTHSIFNIDDFPILKNYLIKHVSYLEKSSESELVGIIGERTKSNPLTPEEKKDLFLSLSDLHSVGPTTLNKLELFCDISGKYRPLCNLINSNLNIPDFLEDYKIVESENIFSEIQTSEYLRNQETIYGSIIYPNWEKIIQNNILSHSNIKEFYRLIVYYYTQSNSSVETLENKCYIFNGDSFLSGEKIYFDPKLTQFDTGYRYLCDAIKVSTSLTVPIKNILEFFNSKPFITRQVDLNGNISNCRLSTIEAKSLLKYCNLKNINLFEKGYFESSNKELLYKVNSEVNQYYSTDSGLIDFIEEHLSEHFKRLPSELNDFKPNTISNSSLQKAILDKIERYEPYFCALTKILTGENLNRLINNVSKIYFNQKTSYEISDFEFNFLGLLKDEQIDKVRNKLIIATEDYNFSLSHTLCSNTIYFDEGKYELDVSNILPQSKRFEDSSIISNIFDSLNKRGIPESKLSQLFKIEEECSSELFEDIYNELTAKNSVVVDNASQLAFILLYNNYIKNIDLSKIKAWHVDGEKYNLEYTLYLNTHSFISESETLDSRYSNISSLLKLSDKNPEFNACFSKCKIINSPYFNSENESFEIENIKTNLNTSQCAELFNFIFNFWKQSKENMRLIKEIDWSILGKEKFINVIGFNTYLMIFDPKLTYVDERCPSWLIDWVNNDIQKISFINDIGINTHTSQIHLLRKCILNDLPFNESLSINNENDKLLYQSTFDFIVENNIKITNDINCNLLYEIAEKSNITLSKIPNVRDLETLSISFDKIFEANYYKEWSDKFECKIHFFEGEIPYKIKIDNYTLRTIQEGNIELIDDTIYLNKNYFSAEKDLIRINTKEEVLDDEAYTSLLEYIIGSRLPDLQNQTLDTTVPNSNDVLPPDSNLSKDEMIKRAREYKDRVKAYLANSGFDVSNWSENYAHIRGVIDPQGFETELLIKGAKNGKLFISPIEWLVLSKQNSKLIAINSNDTIVNVPFEELMKEGSRFHMQFRTETFSKKGIFEFAKVFQYVSDCKFIIDSPGFSYSDFMEKFGLYEKQEGLVTSSTDEDF